LGSVQKKLREIQRKTGRLLELYLDEHVSRPQYLEKKAQLEGQERALDARYKALRSSDKVFNQTIETICQTFLEMPKIYTQASDSDKVKILKEIATDVLIENKKLRVKIKEPFSYFLLPEILRVNKTSDRKQVRACSAILPYQYSTFHC